MNLESRRVISFMSEENLNITNFNDAVNLLDSISKESFLSEAWIPSLERTVKIQEINAKQQKTLIESAIDSAVSKSTFSKFFYEIVSSNCLEDKSVIESFTVVDKISIGFSMRQQISNTLKVIFQNDPKIENDIKISSIVEKFSNYKHPLPETLKFSKNSVNMEVDMIIPIFSTEGSFDSYIYGKEKIKDDQIQELKKLVTNAFLGETAKFIKDVRVNDKSLNYSNLHVPQKIQLMERLPASLVQDILEKAVKWKSEIEQLSLVEYEVSGVKYSKNIEVDSLLFINN